MKTMMNKISITAISLATLMTSSVATLAQDSLVSPREFILTEGQSNPSWRVPDDEFNINLGSGMVVDLSTAMSGDTVGNGNIGDGLENRFNDEDDHHHNPFGDILLSPNERDSRNNGLDSLMERLGIDPAEIRSGDTVGNGGGLLEAQAYFYYESLSKHIISAFEQDIVTFTDFEKSILSKILEGLALGQSSESKLLFISEKDYPGFFYNPEVDPAPRVAKTGFDLNYPIFINRDYIYAIKDINPRFFLGLIVHEMGHQVGVANHTFLDELGAKVVLVSEMNKSQLSLDLLPSNKIEISYYNHDFFEAVPDMFVSFKDKLVSVTNFDSNAIRTACGNNHKFNGLMLSNLHWKNRGIFGVTDAVRLVAGAWADVKCYDEYSGAYYNKLIDLHVRIDIDKDYLRAQVYVQK